MLEEWLFKPIFESKTCTGEIGNMTCHSEAFGVTPILLVVVIVFIGYLTFASFINKWKQKKVDRKNEKEK